MVCILRFGRQRLIINDMVNTLDWEALGKAGKMIAYLALPGIDELEVHAIFCHLAVSILYS